MYAQIISMKNLFSVLPSDFFKPLNSRYKDQYADCILAIYNSYKAEISYGVDRESVVSTLTEYFNTRTTAVFTIKYLRFLGYKADNDIFAENSRYFRNALVRANYSNLQNGIQENSEFLELFFRNLILGENNELKNRYTHIDYDLFARKFGDNSEISEKKFGDNEKSSEKTSEIILLMLKENPKLSAKKLSEKIGITSRAVEKQLANLVQKGIIKREGSPKGGHWEIVNEEN